MLSKSEKKQLIELIKNSISGVVLKSDLKEWLLKLQYQSIQIFNSCDSAELISIAKHLGIRVVNTKNEYEKLKKKYGSLYIVPDLKSIKEENKSTETMRVIERPNKLKDADPSYIKKLYYDENKSAIKICKMYGCSTTTFYRYLAKYEIEYKQSKKLTDEQVAECIEYRKQGMTYKEIASKFNVTRQCIQERLIRTKEINRKRAGLKEENYRLKKILEEKQEEIKRLKKMLNLKEAI